MFQLHYFCKYNKLNASQQVVRITVLVTDTTAPFIQQGKGLLVITIIDVNEKPPVSL